MSLPSFPLRNGAVRGAFLPPLHGLLFQSLRLRYRSAETFLHPGLLKHDTCPTFQSNPMGGCFPSRCYVVNPQENSDKRNHFISCWMILMFGKKLSIPLDLILNTCQPEHFPHCGLIAGDHWLLQIILQLLNDMYGV